MYNTVQSYEYFHYTNKETKIIDLSRSYEQTPDMLQYNKPCGLWLSVKSNDDWENLCRSNGFIEKEFIKERFANKFRIYLKEGSHILCIDSIEKHALFQKEYGRIEIPEKLSSNTPLFLIDWSRIISMALD